MLLVSSYDIDSVIMNKSISALIKAKADVDMVNSFGWDVFMCAKSTHQPKSTMNLLKNEKDKLSNRDKLSKKYRYK
jgi:hypothetical protein